MRRVETSRVPSRWVPAPCPVDCTETDTRCRRAKLTAATTSSDDSAATTAIGCGATAKFHGATAAAYSLVPGRWTLLVLRAQAASTGPRDAVVEVVDTGTGLHAGGQPSA